MNFNIMTIQNEEYIVNTGELFDAFHCLDHQRTNSRIISDNANINLNCFLRNANEAFISNKPFSINGQVIHDKSELLEWISTHGTPEFQEDMVKRFNIIMQ